MPPFIRVRREGREVTCTVFGLLNVVCCVNRRFATTSWTAASQKKCLLDEVRAVHSDKGFRASLRRRAARAVAAATNSGGGQIPVCSKDFLKDGSLFEFSQSLRRDQQRPRRANCARRRVVLPWAFAFDQSPSGCHGYKRSRRRWPLRCLLFDLPHSQSP